MHAEFGPVGLAAMWQYACHRGSGHLWTTAVGSTPVNSLEARSRPVQGWPASEVLAIAANMSALPHSAGTGPACFHISISQHDHAD